MAVPLSDPCLSNPCQNGGECFVLTSDPAGFHCSCPPNTKGPVCHRQLRQVLSCQDKWSRVDSFTKQQNVCVDFSHSVHDAKLYISIPDFLKPCLAMAMSVSQSKTYVQISQQLLNELQFTFIPRKRFVMGTLLASCLVPSS